MSFNVPLYHYDTTVVIFTVTAVLYPIAKNINTLLPITFSNIFLPFLIQRLISPLVSMMMMINIDKYLLHTLYQGHDDDYHKCERASEFKQSERADK